MWTIIDDKEKPATPLPDIDEAIQLQEEKKPRPTIGTQGLYLAAIIVLSLTLFLQIFTQFTQSVIATPLLRQPVVWSCDILNCQLPARERPSDWTLTTSSMKMHPDFLQAWRIQAELQHQGTQALSLPALLITFYGREGEIVAARHFTPDEYQGEVNSRSTARTSAQEWQPGSVVTLALDIADPGAGLPNFDIELSAVPVEAQP